VRVIRAVVLLFGWGLVLVMMAGPAGALTITDVDPTDLNSITRQLEDDVHNELMIFEDYNELNLVPYCGHDPFAIVNDEGGYFDKVVTFTDDDLDGEPWTLDFRVQNTTPWCWSDYHFEFWNEDFTERLVDFPLLQYSDEIFLNEAFPGPYCGEGVLEFWAPNWQCPYTTNQFLLRIDLSGINSGLPGSFGIRQVATTVAEPVTMLGLVLGIGGVGAYIRRRVRGMA